MIFELSLELLYLLLQILLHQIIGSSRKLGTELLNLLAKSQTFLPTR